MATLTSLTSLGTAYGLQLQVREWLSTHSPAPRGTVLLVHGLGEHIGRYEHVAAHLLRSGRTNSASAALTRTLMGTRIRWCKRSSTLTACHSRSPP